MNKQRLKELFMQERPRSRASISFFNTGKTILLLAIPALFVCCSGDKKTRNEPKENKIGAYVYLDHNEALHTKLNCSAIYKTHSSQPVEPVRTEHLKAGYLYKICSRCVSENNLDSLHEIVDNRNVYKSQDPYMYESE